MPAAAQASLPIDKANARRIWLRAQRLHDAAPFGSGAEAVAQAVRHLGYVQIDTINVVERAHHHILWSRIPAYRAAHLRQAQSEDRSVFEYWTHALAYVPTSDLRYFLPAMRSHRLAPRPWFSTVTKADLRKVMTLIRDGGPLTIRDIEDDVLVAKDHAWASRKPSKRALQLAFFTGALTVSARTGMLKTYDLAERHFGWSERPRPAREADVLEYQLDRALRSQGLVSLDSICHLEPSRKAAMRDAIDKRVRRKRLVPVAIADAPAIQHWIEPERLDDGSPLDADPIHVLSPFDPLVIQRRRLQLLFDYEHRFEAYVPQNKRVLGYFALPVLAGERIVAAIDIKADRRARRLLLQKWTWIDPAPDARMKARIDEALGRFEVFQFQDLAVPGQAAMMLADEPCEPAAP